MSVQIQLRRGTAAEWTTANPILAAGEIGLETDTLKMKIGTGVLAWAALAYVTAAAAAHTHIEADVTSLVADLANKQPLDSDLTAIAALTTTAYGRALLALADAAAGRTAFGLGTAATADTGTGAANLPTKTQADTLYQPLDSDLTAIAALSTTAFGRSYLALADALAARALAESAPLAATYITQTANSELSGEQALSALATGYLKNTTGTGVLSVQAPPIPVSDIATVGLPVDIGVAVSDETTVITTGTAKLTFRTRCAMTLTSVRASLKTASSSGVVTIDLNEGGVSVFSTTLTIDSGEKTSTTAAIPAVISDSALADDAEMTVDIDTAGTGAVGLKLWLIGTRA